MFPEFCNKHNDKNILLKKNIKSSKPYRTCLIEIFDTLICWTRKHDDDQEIKNWLHLQVFIFSFDILLPFQSLVSLLPFYDTSSV